MKINNTHAPQKTLRGVSIFVITLIVVTFVACSSGLTKWGNDQYSIEFDETIYEDVVGDESTLVLSMVDGDKNASITINAIYPFTYNIEDGIDSYLVSAQKSLESRFTRISNKSTDQNVQKGVTIKSMSISGDMEDRDGVSLGMLRMMISDDTLLHITAVGNASLLRNNMEEIFRLFDSAVIK